MSKPKIPDHHFENDFTPPAKNPDAPYSDDFVRQTDEIKKMGRKVQEEKLRKSRG